MSKPTALWECPEVYNYSTLIQYLDENKFLKSNMLGNGEKAQWLTALAAPEEDQSSISNIHKAAHNHL